MLDASPTSLAKVFSCTLPLFDVVW